MSGLINCSFLLNRQKIQIKHQCGLLVQLTYSKHRTEAKKTKKYLTRAERNRTRNMIAHKNTKAQNDVITTAHKLTLQRNIYI